MRSAAFGYDVGLEDGEIGWFGRPGDVGVPLVGHLPGSIQRCTEYRIDSDRRSFGDILERLPDGASLGDFRALLFREKAEESSKAGRHDESLVIIKDATTEVRRGLRYLGVNM